MVRLLAAVIALWLPSAPPLSAQDTTRYVSDEIPIVLRADRGADAGSLGALAAGTRLTLLETAGGYARVRTEDGREGWVREFYLKATPPARERAARAEKQLAEAKAALEQAQAELRKVQGERDKLMQDLARIAQDPDAAPGPPPELLQEAEALRARVNELEEAQARAAAQQTVKKKREDFEMMLFGGALVLAGFVLAWLALPKRRW